MTLDDPNLPTVKFGAVTYRLPFHALLRALTPIEETGLRASIARRRKVLNRVVTYDSATYGERCVIDGANRLLIAVELGLDVPVQHRGPMPDEDARAECLDLNLERRHLTPEEQQARRAERVARVTTAKEVGLTTREIADLEGVSQTQVILDLAKATRPTQTRARTKNRAPKKSAPLEQCDPAEQGCSNPVAAKEPEQPAPLEQCDPVEQGCSSDPFKPIEKLQRALLTICQIKNQVVAGALPDLLRGPYAGALRRIAARRGAPLDGDRWPLLERFQEIVSDLAVEVTLAPE